MLNWPPSLSPSPVWLGCMEGPHLPWLDMRVHIGRLFSCWGGIVQHPALFPLLKRTEGAWSNQWPTLHCLHGLECLSSWSDNSSIIFRVHGEVKTKCCHPRRICRKELIKRMLHCHVPLEVPHPVACLLFMETPWAEYS